MKKTPTMGVGWVSGATVPEGSRLGAWLETLLELQSEGALILRSGNDLLLQGVDGRVERIADFFDLNELLHLELQNGDLADIWRSILGLVDPEPGRLYAQANTGSTSDSPSPIASRAVAKVSEVFGVVQVVRDGETLLLSVGDDVLLGDVVSTQADSRVKLDFFGASAGADAANSTLIADQTKVSISGQVDSSAATGNQITQITLKIESGTLTVGQSAASRIAIQVETPSGRVEVPQVGLVVSIQPESPQPTFQVPRSSNESSTAATTTPVRLTAPDGTVQQLVLQQVPAPAETVALAPAPAPIAAPVIQPAPTPSRFKRLCAPATQRQPGCRTPRSRVATHKPRFQVLPRSATGLRPEPHRQHRAEPLLQPTLPLKPLIKSTTLLWVVRRQRPLCSKTWRHRPSCPRLTFQPPPLLTILWRAKWCSPFRCPAQPRAPSRSTFRSSRLCPAPAGLGTRLVKTIFRWSSGPGKNRSRLRWTLERTSTR